ncbi:MAG TPA: agmatine deiminase family protein [Ferruginibacter sp.]|jgi:agmatine/peptidylarginine deiminase|nr:agmatine deiminase family protein [Ferruginibacter sp.]
MIFTEYSKVTNLILAYPERYYNEYEKLTSFYDSLINIIPNDIQLWLITNNNATKIKLESKYRYKKINVIGIKGWDEIWLRDCIGINTSEGIIKPYYHPQYCSLHRYGDYFEHINKQSRIIIKECLQKKINYMPLVIDGGNFSNNDKTVFLTNKILDDNKELSKSEIINILKDFTSLQPEIIERCENDSIGHTDGFLNFISNSKVLLSNYPSLSFLKEDIQFIYRVRKKLKEEKLEVIELYDRPIDEIVPCECYRKTKKACFYSARGNYINFLRLNNTIILPEYTLPSLRETKYYNNINKDSLTQLGFQVKTINCDMLSKEGGSLHCLSYPF